MSSILISEPSIPGNFSINTFGKPLHELTPAQLQELYDLANDQAAAPSANGIMQVAKGGRIGLQDSYEGTVGYAQLREKMKHYAEIAGSDNIYALIETATEAGDTDFVNQLRKNFTLEGFEGVEDPDFSTASGALGAAKGGRIRKAPGGIMNLGGLEKDYRPTGGFVPIGAYEKKDDVPARLSKNEFVMTADAVRAAGGGSINRGAQRMYNTMKHLEASPGSKRMTA